MARTTSDNVKGILLTNYDTAASPSLTPFIDTASAMVDALVTKASSRSLTINATLLEIIERWLSAHYYAHADQLLTSKSTAGASGSFQGQSGMGLDSTQYGQAAKRLDPTGILAGMDDSAGVVEMHWLGKTAPNKSTYQERN